MFYEEKKFFPLLKVPSGQPCLGHYSSIEIFSKILDLKLFALFFWILEFSVAAKAMVTIIRQQQMISPIHLQIGAIEAIFVDILQRKLALLCWASRKVRYHDMQHAAGIITFSLSNAVRICIWVEKWVYVFTSHSAPPPLNQHYYG